VELVDLATFDLPIFNEPRHPIMGQYEFEHTKQWATSVSRADAIKTLRGDWRLQPSEMSLTTCTTNGATGQWGS
jgi:hypothetical protein